MSISQSSKLINCRKTLCFKTLWWSQLILWCIDFMNFRFTWEIEPFWFLCGAYNFTVRMVEFYQKGSLWDFWIVPQQLYCCFFQTAALIIEVNIYLLYKSHFFRVPWLNQREVGNSKWSPKMVDLSYAIKPGWSFLFSATPLPFSRLLENS